jgi:hypothetical protein
MLERDVNIHHALAAGLLTWDLLTICDGLIEDVDGASPNVELHRAA